MDMRSKSQYLKALIEKRGYLLKSKKEKSKLLDEYCQTTGLKRKYVIRKIRSGQYLKENLNQRKRKIKYDGYLKDALVKIWRILVLYQKIPVKLSDEWDRSQLGNIQTDLIEHGGQSARGEYLNTVSNTDIATGWWEGEAIMGRGQIPTGEGLDKARKRFPFQWGEIHSDNGTEYINAYLFKYTQKEGLGFSRSRPNKKNDNCFVEQKNWTHVKKYVGYLRYDTLEELEILNSLYRNELRLYKNFFQPVIKLISKERIGGKIHRKYDVAKTPYQRVMESKEVSEQRKQELKKIYDSLNPAELKRAIDRKLDLLYKTYKKKQKLEKVEPFKKLKPNSVTFNIIQPEPFRLPT